MDLLSQTDAKIYDIKSKAIGDFVSINITNIKGLAKELSDIDPNYVKKAIKLGQLEAGEHFFTVGGSEPLFQLDAELVKKLHESCRKKPECRTQKPKTTTSGKINFGSLGLAHLDSSKPTGPKPTGPKTAA